MSPRQEKRISDLTQARAALCAALKLLEDLGVNGDPSDVDDNALSAIVRAYGARNVNDIRSISPREIQTAALQQLLYDYEEKIAKKEPDYCLDSTGEELYNPEAVESVLTDTSVVTVEQLIHFLDMRVFPCKRCRSAVAEDSSGVCDECFRKELQPA